MDPQHTYIGAIRSGAGGDYDCVEGYSSAPGDLNLKGEVSFPYKLCLDNFTFKDFRFILLLSFSIFRFLNPVFVYGLVSALLQIVGLVIMLAIQTLPFTVLVQILLRLGFKT